MSRVSNYDKALAGARAAFLAHDPAALAAKYPVEWDGRCLRLRFAGEPYRIDAETGAVDCPDRPGYVPGHDELMSIWDMLCFADARPAPAGEWCPTASLADIAGGSFPVSEIPSNSVRMAMAVIGILPILIIYPLVQKYLVRGVVVGAVKG